MHNSAWEALLRHIPPEQHNQYIIVTAAGVEIALQTFLRIEAELVVLKGRLSGSQDQGLVFFIPYKHIDYLATAKAVKDSEFNEVFGSFTFPLPQPEEWPADPVCDPEPPSSAAADNGNGTHRPGHGSGLRPAIRSEVLERYRNSRTTPPTG